MPSLGEVSGDDTFESRIWVNEEHGESTYEEAEMLDKIRTIGEETDGDIDNIYDEYLEDDEESPAPVIDFTSDWEDTDDLNPILLKDDGSIEFIPEDEIDNLDPLTIPTPPDEEETPVWEKTVLTIPVEIVEE